MLCQPPWLLVAFLPAVGCRTAVRGEVMGLASTMARWGSRRGRSRPVRSTLSPCPHQLAPPPRYLNRAVDAWPPYIGGEVEDFEGTRALARPRLTVLPISLGARKLVPLGGWRGSRRVTGLSAQRSSGPAQPSRSRTRRESEQPAAGSDPRPGVAAPTRGGHATGPAPSSARGRTSWHRAQRPQRGPQPRPRRAPMLPGPGRRSMWLTRPRPIHHDPRSAAARIATAARRPDDADRRWRSTWREGIRPRAQRQPR